MFAGFKNLKTHPEIKKNGQRHRGIAAPPREQN
jgi:hypothetical protein